MPRLAMYCRLILISIRNSMYRMIKHAHRILLPILMLSLGLLLGSFFIPQANGEIIEKDNFIYENMGRSTINSIFILLEKKSILDVIF